MNAFSNLGIEWWSVVLYLVNIFLLVAILTWVLYKPVIAIMDKRRKTIQDSIEEAEQLKLSFEKTQRELEEEKREMRKRLDEEMKAGKRELEEQKRALVEEMEKKSAQFERELAERRENLLAEVRGDLLAQVESVVVRVMGDVASAEDVQKSARKAFDSIEV